MASRKSLEPIAVVGVSALFPGSVHKDGFWRDILAGKDLMSDVPASHWLIEDYYDADPKKPDKTYARRGGFLPDVDFDPVAWGVPPSIVPATDTAQLLALIVAKQVLDDASQNQFEKLDREKMSCILGVTSAQELLASMVSRLQRPVWVKALRESGVAEDEVQAICDRIVSNYAKWEESTFPGLLGNVVAGRIANRLDLGGTNCVTDAACASTFSALSMAVNELWLGQSDVVICGGVDTMNDIFMYMCFSKTPALSASGDCRPFSDQADGTMLGEGLGMVALRRLSDAERDGDRVYAVIKGVGSSSDGRAKSVYAPVSEGQAKALRRTYEMAGYGADTVELMEAHGTGTKAGDAAEFEGLRMVFDESGRADRQWCQIGSVKSQIGHTKAAAGAAGLVKAVLALHTKTLPPTIKVSQPNPKLALEKSPFHVTTRARPWARPAGHPRRASVSSFGFGGSNFHIALEEYEGPAKRAFRARTTESELVILTGATAADVAAQARALAKDANEPGLLTFLAQSTQASYDASANARLALVATAAELGEKLTKGAELADKGVSASTPNGVFFGVGGRDGDVGFLFPGQGSQSIDMGAHVAMAYDDAAAAWDLTRAVDFGADVSLHEVVFPKTVFNPQDKAANDARLTATEWAQPAIGAASLALFKLARRIGLTPAAVAGHSFGEVTALHAAGAISEADLLRVARKRGELMRDAAASTSGSMTAVSAKVEDLRPKLEAWGIDVVIANHNAPEQVVLSGATSAIEAVEAKLADAGLTAKRLNVATAFHSKLVSPSTIPFRTFLDGVEVAAPKLDVYANATAAPYGADATALRAQLAEQIASSVRFVECVEAMYARGVRTFVEVGPGSVLTGLAGRILKGRAHRAVALDRSGKDGVTALHLGLGQLVADGVPMQLGALWDAYGPVEDPRTTTKPKLLLKINGANYGKPYPPKGGAAALPKPNAKSTIAIKAPAVATEVAAKAVAQANGTNGHANGNGTNGKNGAHAQVAPRIEARTAPAAGGGLQMVSGGNGNAPRAHASSQGSQPPVAQPSAPVSSAQPTVLPAQPPAATGAWLDAYRAAQTSAAEAHAAYQRAMAETHAAFLRTAEASIHGLTSLVTGARPAATPATAPVFAAPAAPIAAAPAPITVAPAPIAVAPAPMAPIAVTPAPVAAPAPAVARPAPAPVAAPAPKAAPALDVEKLLMLVVAEKTGYPEEMLAAGMDLEADLGVDSIKRVEILSTMRERAPGLPDVDAGEMAKLRTLGQIVDYMRGKMPTGASAPAASTPAPAAKAAAPAPGVDVEKLLMVVVAEKTGYPEEMLGGGMDLEADLGVDSIKRVEILSTMRERAPGLPDVDAGEMAKLRTLGQIVDYMRGKMPASASAPAPAAPAAAAKAAVPAPGIDVEKLLMVVVAEKTGYPEEMLGGGMDLEADLGVDSIKRVEILSTMRERAPGLPDVDAGEMAKLRTLGQIVDYMRGKLPASSAPVANAPVASASSTDVEKLLMVVVAEKTGYPEEMLGGGMDLEADLGVDSIKRVEILSTMRERSPGLPDVDAGEMAKLRTLGQIVDYMQSRLGPQSSGATRLSGAPEPAPAAPAKKIDPRLGRFVTRRVTAPASGFALRGLLDTKRLVVTDDGNGVAAALVTELRARGVASEAVADIPSDADGVIFLGGLRDVVDVSHAVSVNREAFRAAKVVAPRASTTGGVFVTVQDTGGDFGLAGTPRAWLGGLPGLVKTAAQEWAKAGLRAIDLERGGRTAPVLAKAIADELFAGGTEIEVALAADGARTTLVSVREAIAEAKSPVGPQSVVVASGGARGVTAATLIALAKATKCRIVLLGRTALADEPAACVGKRTDAELKRALLDDARARGAAITPAALGAEVAKVLANREVRENVEAIKRAGGDALYVPADVQDADALRAALADVRAKWGPITGIVHGAGVLADRFIVDKTEEQFDRVFDTKVGGLRVLLAATREDPIDTMCFFSSVAARSGNQGQCDYAMANEVLNKVAAAERARRGGDVVVKSIGWGPWEGGMVTPQLKARFEALGVPLIPLDVGADMLVAELTHASPNDVELCMGGEPKPEALLASDAHAPELFELHVSARTHGYLDGHRVKGAPVVPVVLVAEWFARAASACRPDLELVALEGMRVLKGIVLTGFEGEGDRFVVEAKKLSNGASATYALELRSASGTKHYQAKAVLAKERSAGAVPQTPAGLGAFDGPVYGDVLFHGETFQVIRSLDGMSKDGVSASLVGTQAVGWGGEGFRTDPALLDGGLQLALLWTQHTLGGASLPTGLSGIRIHRGGLVSGASHAILRARDARGDRGVCDIVFVAADGAPVASLEGVETHVLPGSRGNA